MKAPGVDWLVLLESEDKCEVESCETLVSRKKHA